MIVFISIFADMKQRIYCLLFFSFFSSVLFAQNSVDYKIFMDYAQGYSTLFRGELPASNGDKISNDGSTYFAYSDRFEKGNLLYRGKWYYDVLLNLDAQRDELYVVDFSRGFPVVVNKNFVDSVFIGAGGGHWFVRLAQKSNPVISSGYYEVLYSGKVMLYKKIRKQFNQKTSNDKRLLKWFTLSEGFYLYKNDRWYRVGSKGDLQKIYAQQKRDIDLFLKRERVDFRRDKTQALVYTITYLEGP